METLKELALCLTAMQVLGSCGRGATETCVLGVQATKQVFASHVSMLD